MKGPFVAPLVFLDTSVLKHAVDRRIVSRTEEKTVQWGGQDSTISITRWEEEFPNEREPESFRRHLVLISLIAHLARSRRVRLAVHGEVRHELWGLPKARDTRGLFQGAPIERAPDPTWYSRIVVGGVKKPKDHLREFLEGLDHTRFLELQKVTGANNLGPKRLNQMCDAFHIWTAEEGNADFFLTTDLRLVKSASSDRPEKPRVSIVSPMELVTALFTKRILRLRDFITWALFELRTKRRGPENHPEEQLLDISQRTKQP